MEPEFVTKAAFTVIGMKYRGKPEGDDIPQLWRAFGARMADIQDAVNYRTITKRVIQLVEGSSFYLVEKMAAEIAAVCLTDPRVERARVRVEKPGALRFARSVGIEIERSRDG